MCELRPQPSRHEDRATSAPRARRAARVRRIATGIVGRVVQADAGSGSEERVRNLAAAANAETDISEAIWELEPPQPDENCVVVDGTARPEAQVGRFLAAIGFAQGAKPGAVPGCYPGSAARSSSVACSNAATSPASGPKRGA